MGKGQKVVIDTNVIISAFGRGGKPYRIMELPEQGKIRNCLSEHTLKELIAALAYPKLSFSHAIKKWQFSSLTPKRFKRHGVIRVLSPEDFLQGRKRD